MLAAISAAGFPTALPQIRNPKSEVLNQTVHWSFRPLSAAKNEIRNSKAKSPIDAIVRSALSNKGLRLSPPLDRRRLVRRITFDLIGLPPTPEEVETFVNDPDPRAYEKLVDSLLASPHYGERWGRHWLDVARYADSDGQESDHDRPNAFRYRDFVIKALNDDMPYDRFVRWQLAGDEYEPDNPSAISATGFVAAGTRAQLPDNLLAEERIRERYNELDDMVTTTGVAFLGLTLGCARCHDHKYDPIPTRDYYRMTAAFNASERSDVGVLPREELTKRRNAEREWSQRRDKVLSQRDKLLGDKRKETELKTGVMRPFKEEEIRGLFTAEEHNRWNSLTADLKRIESERPDPVPTVFALQEKGAGAPESWLLDRGDFHRRKEKVTVGFLSCLTRGRTSEQYWDEALARRARGDSTYQRKAMADWITDIEHGPGALLARVAVNRVWQGHFGEGIVRTVNDFGKRSDKPSHPELLEYLANRLVQGGWKLKPIHRMIVLSETYKQGTTYDARGAKIDPENRLLWRRTPRRIESEIFRDSILSVAGTLNRQIHGPAFRPPIQQEAMLARNVQDPYPSNIEETSDTLRRTVYMFHKRVVPYPLLQVFDGPDASASCGRRNVSTVAPQALAILNEPFVRRRAAEFGARLQKEAEDDRTAQVKRGYVLALGRQPSAKELDASVRFLELRTKERSTRAEQSAAAALTDFAQVIFGLNEFIYVD
jgi:hypothetical protein